MSSTVSSCNSSRVSWLWPEQQFAATAATAAEVGVVSSMGRSNSIDSCAASARSAFSGLSVLSGMSGQPGVGMTAAAAPLLPKSRECPRRPSRRYRPLPIPPKLPANSVTEQSTLQSAGAMNLQRQQSARQPRRQLPHFIELYGARRSRYSRLYAIIGLLQLLACCLLFIVSLFELLVFGGLYVSVNQVFVLRLSVKQEFFRPAHQVLAHAFLFIPGAVIAALAGRLKRQALIVTTQILSWLGVLLSCYGMLISVSLYIVHILHERSIQIEQQTENTQSFSSHMAMMICGFAYLLHYSFFFFSNVLLVSIAIRDKCLVCCCALVDINDDEDDGNCTRRMRQTRIKVQDKYGRRPRALPQRVEVDVEMCSPTSSRSAGSGLKESRDWQWHRL